MSKVWIDPASGWQFGFPKVYDPDVDGDCTAWLLAQGLPEELTTLPCRMWGYKEEDV
jgi:hypothetical protein